MIVAHVLVESLFEKEKAKTGKKYEGKLSNVAKRKKVILLVVPETM